MKNYIRTKIVKAEPMSEGHFKGAIKGAKGVTAEELRREGYLVVYPDGYKSWSPKEAFESAYREVADAEIDFLITEG